MRTSILCILLLLSLQSFSQNRNRKYPFADTLKSVTLDSVMVTSKRGLDMTDFVNVMLNDTAFYEAFRNMIRFSFIAENHINTYDNNNKRTGKMYRKISHDNSGPAYKQEVLEKSDSGKIYDRKGGYELYTVEMFSYLFMNDKNTDFIASTVSKKKKDEEGYKAKLKTLIFNPGKPLKGVPLIGGKTEIFSAEMRAYYNYSFYYATYQDSIPVYYFKCKMKPGLKKGKQDEIMIKELTTIFNAKNMDILGRFIDMKYNSIPFDFDVKMNIELAYKKGMLVPVKINYDGSWDIPFKSPENCTFDIRHYNYK